MIEDSCVFSRLDLAVPRPSGEMQLCIYLVHAVWFLRTGGLVCAASSTIISYATGHI